MKKTIGIDLGTTNSVMAFKDSEVKIIRSKENDELIRSCVSLLNDEIVVGRIAYTTGMIRNPENTIISIKRLMGGSIEDKMVQEMIENKKYYKFGITELIGGTKDSVAVLLGGKQYTPEEISAEILKKLKQDAEEKLGDKITHAVITVPAYFTEKQKNATRIAAQLANLKVQKLLSEPTAAAIAYGVDQLKTGEAVTVLIYDFGGGTFDLSILNIVDGQYMEAGTGGDRWLGGDDIDRMIIDMIYRKTEKEYQIDDIEQLIERMSAKNRSRFEGEVKVKAEEAKIQLSSLEQTDIFIPNSLEDENEDIIDIDFKISRSELEECIKPLIQRTVDLVDELIKEVGYDITMIDKILLVGGTSCIPLIKKMLSKKFGGNKILVSEKPMLAIAEGAGVLSHRLGDEYEPTIEPSKTISNISYSTNHTYFIEYRTIDGEIGFKTIIEKQVPLPATKSVILKTIVNNQKIARVSIFTDVEGGKKEKLGMGYFTIDADLQIQSELVFDINLDENEVFTITAYPKGFKQYSKEIVIGRGDKDSKALKAIEECTGEIVTHIDSWRVQDKYFEQLKELVKLAEKIGRDNPKDKRWAEIDFKIKNAYDEALKEDKEEQEGNRDKNIVGAALLLLEEYRSLIHSDVASELISLIRDQETADPFEREKILARIDKITDNYTTLYALFKLRVAADNAVNGPDTGHIGDTDAEKDAMVLKQNHDKILSYFQSGKRDEGFALLNEIFPLAKKYL